MIKTRISAIVILLLGIFVGYFVYTSEPTLENIKPIPAPAAFKNFPFKLGLDLSGGTHLIYKADLSAVKSSDVADSMASLRDIIERRVNLFGVSEPIVQTEEASLSASREQRLIVDLPGVTDIDRAVAMIGQTPLLEFKTEGENDYVATSLTGRYLERAILEFDQNTREPIVSLQFNSEGTDLFSKITKENVGKTVAIYLDGSPISTPVVREEISGGRAQISGSFTPVEAKTLVGRLNSGALPVPITLISTQTIGPSLGATTIDAGIKAALIGLLFVAIFLILWYRLPGLIAIIALSLYVSIMLALFKLIPVTLTAASIAGFIISIGLAVDANVLIFERLKEEMKLGKSINESMRNGFSRAWFSIRDSNTSSIITAIILFWFGTSLIKGFALVLGLGVLTSMLSAIIISRIFLYALNVKSESKFAKFLFSSGISK
ncbi:MAG TPA: protein translocase subunit SecD [Candidatus Paceibacterota bacterium]